MTVDAVDEIFDLFAAYGASGYDERVSLLDHSLQTAARAVSEHADGTLVVAALLHDLGHLLQARARGTEDYLAGDWDHDRVAQRWLQPHFGPTIGHSCRRRHSTPTLGRRWQGSGPDHPSTRSLSPALESHAEPSITRSVDGSRWVLVNE